MFSEMTSMGHEQVLFCREEASGLQAIIAVHNTTLGPALGGCRVYPYASEEDAVRDVLRLSRGMTYKAAVAGLDLGGGKSVIMGGPQVKNEALLRTFGRHVDALRGRYIVAEDMNTNQGDMAIIRSETQHVAGIPAEMGGLGEPGPVTAWGVYQGLRGALAATFGSADPAGRTVAIQGLGNVGWHLAEHLHEAGAKLVVTDVRGGRIEEAIKAFGATGVDLDGYYDVEADVLAPCAIGAIINPNTIPRLKAPVIAGGANNILDDEVRDGEDLAERGILFAPDYVVNAGGLIAMYCEVKGWGIDKAMRDAERIFDTVQNVFARAKEDGTTTIEASNRIAEERIEAVARVQRLRLP